MYSTAPKWNEKRAIIIIPAVYARWKSLVLADKNQASRVIAVWEDGAAKASYKNRQHRKLSLYLSILIECSRKSHIAKRYHHHQLTGKTYRSRALDPQVNKIELPTLVRLLSVKIGHNGI